MNTSFEHVLTPQDIQKHIPQVLHYLNEKGIESVLSLVIKPTISEKTEIIVTVPSEGEGYKIIRLTLEKIEAKKIKVNEKFLKEQDLQSLNYNTGPVELGDPNKNSTTFNPAISLLPSYWGGC